MTRSSIRSLLAGLAGLVGVLALCASFPSFAQSGTTITISGVSCAQWTLGGTPPNLTLTCGAGGGGPGVPVCTISGATTATVGTATALVARCSPEAASFTWTGGSCAGQVGATCFANEAMTGQEMYTVQGTNGAGTGAVSAGLPVTWVAAPPPAPTGCSIARNPANGLAPAVGGPVGMTGSCSGGGTPTAWNWQRNGVVWPPWSPNNASQADWLPQNTGASPITYTYTLTACNGASCASAISTTFTVAGTGGGGGGGGTIDCGAGFAKTTEYDLTWGTATNTRIAVGPNEAVVVKFTVPPGAPPSVSGHAGHLDIFEYGSAGDARWTTIWRD